MLNVEVNFFHGGFDRVKGELTAGLWVDAFFSDDVCDVVEEIFLLDISFFLVHLHLAFFQDDFDHILVFFLWEKLLKLLLFGLLAVSDRRENDRLLQNLVKVFFYSTTIIDELVAIACQLKLLLVDLHSHD